MDLDNRRLFTDLINENMTSKHIPGIIAQSSELRKLKVRNEAELSILKRIKSEDVVKESIPKAKTKEEQDQIQVKPICLLVGYMYNFLTSADLQTESMASGLETILRAIPSYIDIMLEQTMMLS